MTRRARAAAALVALVLVGRALAQPAGASPDGADAVPPRRLGETGLYAGGRTEVVDASRRPFTPQYPLWSDGAVKRRWVYLPEGTTIDAGDAGEWRFPVGTRFWKEFSFKGRKVETRFLWKASGARWVAASYVWNEEGTDAVLAPESGVPGVAELAPGRRHAIPSRTDCAACHGPQQAPLGFNALQLSTDRDPNAIHGEPLTPDMLTLKTLVHERLLSHAPEDLVARPPRIATADPRTRAVLGYLAANCGACHDGTNTIAALVPSLKHTDLMRDGDAAARALIGRPTRWQAPGQPEGATVLADPASPGSSALLLRMASRRPSSQMPPLGTVVRDQEAVDVIREWIETLRRSPEP